MQNEFLFHVSTEDKLNSILARGVDTFCCWTSSLMLVEYFCEFIGANNKVPVIIAMPWKNFGEQYFSPDYEGFDEPLTEVLKISKREITDRWETSSKSWKDSVEIIKSVRYDAFMYIDLADVHPYTNTLDLALELSRDNRYESMYLVKRTFITGTETGSTNNTSIVENNTLYDKILEIM